MGKHFTSFRVMNINDAGTSQVFLQVLNNIDTSCTRTNSSTLFNTLHSDNALFLHSNNNTLLITLFTPPPIRIIHCYNSISCKNNTLL